METLSKGALVKRIANDYTNGRTGTIIDQDLIKNRYRVHWTASASGKPENIRTWVKREALEVL